MDFSNSKFLYDEDGKTKTHIQTDLGSSRFIVFSITNNNNTYQEYLDWVAEGNSEAAD
tara:strand:+ start:790 stop:963 length:174 start_codon:yes stop_codon:yes gene_type:complete